MGFVNFVSLFFIFLIGLCFGSFLNVVVLRAFSNESIAYPASKCPKCQKPLYWWHNIPLLSYFLLKGKCYFCKAPISIQYPIVEFITAVLFVALYKHLGMGMHLMYYWAFAFMALVLAISDIKEKVIFTQHAFILGGIGLIYNFIYTIFHFKASFGITLLQNPFVNSVEGLILGAFVMLVYFSVSSTLAGGKMALGDGDIYIAGALGACLGFERTIYMLVLAFAIQIIITLAMYEYHLYKTKDYKIFGSIIAFVILGIGYCLLNDNGLFKDNIVLLMVYTVLWLCVAFYILRDTFKKVWSMKEKSTDAVLENFMCLPFGPALAAAGIGILFFSYQMSVIMQRFQDAYFALWGV